MPGFASSSCLIVSAWLCSEDDEPRGSASGLDLIAQELDIFGGQSKIIFGRLLACGFAGDLHRTNGEATSLQCVYYQAGVELAEPLSAKVHKASSLRIK
jgi:hypothetical protein